MSKNQIIKYARIFWDCTDWRIELKHFGTFVVAACISILQYWANDELNVSNLIFFMKAPFFIYGFFYSLSFIWFIIGFLRGHAYGILCLKSTIKLDLGEYCIIPNTSITAYMVQEKKDDFKMFDYDGGIIISLYMKNNIIGEYVNLRFEYDDLVDYGKERAYFSPVGSMRKQLRRKWLSQYIVDLNDPDWKEKLSQTLKENEKLFYPGKKTETKHQPTNTQNDHK